MKINFPTEKNNDSDRYHDLNRQRRNKYDDENKIRI